MFGYKAFEDGFSMKITFTKWFSDNDEKSFRVGVFFEIKKNYSKMCIALNWYEKYDMRKKRRLFETLRFMAAWIFDLIEFSSFHRFYGHLLTISLSLLNQAPMVPFHLNIFMSIDEHTTWLIVALLNENESFYLLINTIL